MASERCSICDKVTAVLDELEGLLATPDPRLWTAIDRRLYRALPALLAVARAVIAVRAAENSPAAWTEADEKLTEALDALRASTDGGGR